MNACKENDVSVTPVADASGNSFTMKYDKAGNMIENDEFRFQYDYKNRLVKATRKIPGEYMVVTMMYDVLGRRVEKHIDRKSNEGEKVRYTYSNLDAIQEEWTYNIGEGRNLKKELIYGAGIDDIEGYILTRGTEERTFRYHKNHQNSVIAITDGTGKVVESYRYDAFGNLILGFSKNAGKQSTLPGAKNEQRNTNQQDSKMWLKNDRLYTAREYDEELKMYYYRGRHYDPRIGRFIQRDPIDMVDDVNLYRYVGNNPVNYTDPMGLKNKQVVPERTFLQKTYDNTVYAGEVAYGGLATAAQWTNGARQSMPDFIQNRLEGAGQTIIGGATIIRGAIETAGAGGGCIAGGRGCVALPVATSDLVGGVNDVGKGFFYGFIGGQKTTEGFYPVEKSIEATAGNGLAGVTLNVAVNIDPKGLWKGIKNGFQGLLQYGVKNADGVASSIANGHAFTKHIQEFQNLGITTADQLQNHINNVIKTADGTSNMKQLSNSRTAYRDDVTNTVVIVNPNDPDGGTSFIPTLGKQYFLNLQ